MSILVGKKEGKKRGEKRIGKVKKKGRHCNQRKVGREVGRSVCHRKEEERERRRILVGRKGRKEGSSTDHQKQGIIKGQRERDGRSSSS